MVKPERFRGLCWTCQNAETCSIRPTRRSGAIYCEQFESAGPPAPIMIFDQPAPPAPARRSAVEETGYIGLCADCLDQRICSCSKAAGGVWHCEEYR